MVVLSIWRHKVSGNISVVNPREEEERHLYGQRGEQLRELWGRLDRNNHIISSMKQSERRHSGRSQKNNNAEIGSCFNSKISNRCNIIVTRSTVMSSLVGSPAQFVLAELLQYVCWWVVWEVFRSVHGFVHRRDVFDRSLLLMFIMVYDVVHSTQTCPGNSREYLTHSHKTR